jgi:GNAT superfamily N-acetyltransferase
LSVRVTVSDSATTRELRRSVLRPSWAPGTPMHGDARSDAVHLAAFTDQGALVGAGIVLPEPYPLHPDVTAAWQLRGMAVPDDWQGRGIGARLLAAAVEEVRARDGRLLWCTARSPKVGFYERYGLVSEGAEFTQSETGLPHFYMWRPVDVRT